MSQIILPCDEAYESHRGLPCKNHDTGHKELVDSSDPCPQASQQVHTLPFGRCRAGSQWSADMCKVLSTNAPAFHKSSRRCRGPIHFASRTSLLFVFLFKKRCPATAPPAPPPRQTARFCATRSFASFVGQTRYEWSSPHAKQGSGHVGARCPSVPQVPQCTPAILRDSLKRCAKLAGLTTGKARPTRLRREQFDIPH